jgi:hypothetical protein
MQTVYFLRPGLPGARYEIHRKSAACVHSECVDTFDTKGAALARLRELSRRTESPPESLATFHRTANAVAFNVPGAVRRIANGSARSYVFADGSRFVVSDASGYHAAIDANGCEWARRSSATVARGNP